jgi:transposase
MLAPTVRRTWAPRGHTPLMHHWDRHDRISVISGLSVSPIRQRLGLYYQWHHHNIRRDDVRAFLSHLLRHVRGPVIVLWDRLRLHRLPAIRDLCRRVPRLQLEYFPAYAPELNPDEQVWNLAKRRLANGSPDDRFDLALSVIEALEACRDSQTQLRGCIRHSGLSLFFRT